MNRKSALTCLASFVGCAALVASACDDSTLGGGTGGTATTTVTSGNATSAGTTTPTSTTSAGQGGASNKMVEEVTGNITSNKTLSASKDWLLKGIVLVEAGATLTIEKGTKVMGDSDSLGTLVIKQGGKLVAVGTKDEPIVFTSALPAGTRQSGDWGGVIVLGKAPINVAGGTASVEGLQASEIYGGSDANDDSGQISYVRIEFSGVELSPNNEINGLTFAGVGRGTKVDHVMVKTTLDDCFEFFGGTVDAKYLVCYRNGDDSFDTDNGYSGRLQYLFSQKDPTHGAEDNGFEWDNDKDSSNNTPATNPTVFNATICGANHDLAKQQYGMLLRRGTKGRISNAFFSGFEACVDVRNPNTSVTVDHTVCVGNVPENVAYAEDGSNMDTQVDDDMAFDERTWFTSGEGNATAGAVVDCFGEVPNPRPSTMIPGATPPNDGFFDTSAGYVGAFKDGSDDWMTGSWINWEQN